VQRPASSSPAPTANTRSLRSATSTPAGVGFLLRVDDFDASYQRMHAAGVEFLTEPRTERYGRLVVFRDVAGNRWDLLGPA
jgi:predicted enzyme related to lactoylglutathione lyase